MRAGNVLEVAIECANELVFKAEPIGNILVALHVERPRHTAYDEVEFISILTFFDQERRFLETLHP